MAVYATTYKNREVKEIIAPSLMLKATEYMFTMWRLIFNVRQFSFLNSMNSFAIKRSLTDRQLNLPLVLTHLGLFQRAVTPATVTKLYSTCFVSSTRRGLPNKFLLFSAEVFWRSFTEIWLCYCNLSHC